MEYHSDKPRTKKNTNNPAITIASVAIPILLGMYILLTTDSKTAEGSEFVVIGYMMIGLSIFYAMTYVPLILGVLVWMIENKIGFGMMGRMAKNPSPTEVSCIIFLLRGMSIFCIYLLVFVYFQK